MKKLHLIAILLFPLSIFAETIVFNVTFGGNENDFAYSIQQTTDGGYIIAGQTDSYGKGSSLQPDIWIIKIDKFGNKEWDKIFGKKDRGDGAHCVQQTTDAGYIVAGTTSSFGKGYPSMWILKLDTNGDSLWTRIYEGTMVSSAYSIQQTIDGGYIVAGKGAENILKLDRNGNKEWGKRFSWIFYSVKATTDGGYIVAGDSIYRQLEWNYVPCLSIFKLDRRGNIEWYNPLGDDFLGRINAIQQTNDGGYIIAGDSVDFKSSFEYPNYAMTIKLDKKGTKEWNYFGKVHSSTQSIQQTADGGYIVAGNTTDDGHGLDFLITKLDEHGNEKWIKMYGSSGGWEYASSIRQTADTGYIVAGQTDYYGNGRYDMWILKLDENGNGPGADGIFNFNNNHANGFILSPNYPNPFNPVTTIEYQLPAETFVTLRIFNITGGLVKILVKEKQRAGNHQIQWDGRDENGNTVAGGLYLYQLRADGFSQTNKMVFVR